MAQLGHRALAGADIDALIQEAVQMVARELGAPYVSLVECSEVGDAYVQRAGAGLPAASPLRRLLTLTDVGAVAPMHESLAEALEGP